MALVDHSSQFAPLPETEVVPSTGHAGQSRAILDPGFNLTLRPMRYPVFYEMYRNAIKNTWTVEEVDFSTDLVDLSSKISESERHLINRLVAFFATGDHYVLPQPDSNRYAPARNIPFNVESRLTFK